MEFGDEENLQIFEDLCEIDTCVIEKLSDESGSEFSYEAYHSNESESDLSNKTNDKQKNNKD